MSIIVGIYGIYMSMSLRTRYKTLSMSKDLNMISSRRNKDIVSHHKRGAIHGIMMIFFVAMGILISGINNMGIGVIYGINEVTFPRINNISIIILGIAIIITA